jgi:hypothetical protein
MLIGKAKKNEHQKYVLPLELAESVWEILVRRAGANSATSSDHYQCVKELVDDGVDPRFGLEFRFSGALGFGGKVYFQPNSRDWETGLPELARVSCYAEDALPWPPPPNRISGNHSKITSHAI